MSDTKLDQLDKILKENNLYDSTKLLRMMNDWSIKQNEIK